MESFIDLRSDTVSQPTEEMREAMYRAVVGDDIMGEDPTVTRLEEMSAAICGKESALFVSSGTMANQLAVMTFTNRGEEVIVGDTSHIYNLEAGGLAALSQVQTRTISVPNGIYDTEALRELIQKPGIQNPKTGLICLENTNNLNAGLVVPLENINEVCKIGKEEGIPIYMDGARIFNASVASGTEVREIAKNTDALMFALTKGLAAPFGAILVGDREFIDKARWFKQRIGGGYRQAGFMAAPGIIGLKSMISRIDTDHKNAQLLGRGLSNTPGLEVINEIQTSIISCSMKNLPCSLDNFLNKLRDKGIKAKKISKDSFRMVTHYGIKESDIEYVLSTIKDIVGNLE